MSTGKSQFNLMHKAQNRGTHASSETERPVLPQIITVIWHASSFKGHCKRTAEMFQNKAQVFCFVLFFFYFSAEFWLLDLSAVSCCLTRFLRAVTHFRGKTVIKKKSSFLPPLPPPNTHYCWPLSGRYFLFLLLFLQSQKLRWITTKTIKQQQQQQLQQANKHAYKPKQRKRTLST